MVEAQPAPTPPAPAKPAPPSTTPPPLPEVGADPDLEPQVTIIRRDEQVFEEVRIKGELRYVRVTPRHPRVIRGDVPSRTHGRARTGPHAGDQV